MMKRQLQEQSNDYHPVSTNRVDDEENNDDSLVVEENGSSISIGGDDDDDGTRLLKRRSFSSSSSSVTPRRSSHCWKEKLLLLFVGFLFGVLITLGSGLLYSNLSYHDDDDDDIVEKDHNNNNDSEQQQQQQRVNDQNATTVLAHHDCDCDCSKDQTTITTTTTTSPTIVSYSFLQTPRGLNMLSNLTNQLKEERSPVSPLQKLYEMINNKDDDQLSSSCHPFIHKIGRTAYQELGLDDAINLVLDSSNPDLLRMCNAAYLHGTVENFLREKHPTSNDYLQANIDYIKTKICDRLDSVHMGKWECYHGIGHGIVQHIRHQKLYETLQLSIQQCSGDTICENGIFMDHFASTSISSELDPYEAMKVCDDLATKGGRADCFSYAPTEFLLHYPGRYGEAMEYCKTLSETRSTLVDMVACIEGVGIQTAKEHMNDFHEIERICHSPTRGIDPMFREECFDAALEYYKTAMALNTIPDTLCEGLTYYKDQCMQKT